MGINFSTEHSSQRTTVHRHAHTPTADTLATDLCTKSAGRVRERESRPDADKTKKKRSRGKQANYAHERPNGLIVCM